MKKENKQLKKEVFVAEDMEVYVIVGYNDREKAGKALNRYERKECGLLEDELTSANDLKEVKIRKYIKDGEPYYDWSGKTCCEECGTKFNDLHTAFIYDF